MKDENSITVYDIADEAGVSVSTVSRVLNNSAPVKEKTRARVIKVMDKYNFQPNALARSLSKKRTKTIGFILPDITNPFFSEVYVKAERAALDLGYSIFLSNTMNDSEVESIYLKTLVEKQVDGIIFMGGRVNETRTDVRFAEEMKVIMKKTPIVMINGEMEGVDCYRVKTDEADGFRKGLNYLLSLGHKEIALVGGIKGITSTDIKLDIFGQYVESAQIATKEEWIIESGYSIEGGYEAFKRLLSLVDLPTAIIAINDFIAIGIIKAAKEMGLQIPQEVSIIGFDNIYLTTIVLPAITTISHNYQELAAKAVHIIDGVNNNQVYEKEHFFDSELIIRESSCGLMNMG